MASKKILFVRSGGGAGGLCVHAGITAALEFNKIHSTHNAGVSAGAIMAAFDSVGFSAGETAAIIQALEDSDIHQARRLWKFRIPWIDHFLANEPLLEILQKYIPSSVSKLEKPLEVYATRFETGRLVELANAKFCADLRQALLASAAICGAFPKVNIAGELYVDGGVRSNLPIPKNWREFDQVYLLIATPPPDAYQARGGLITNLLMNIGWLMQDQIQDEIEKVSDEIATGKVVVIWPPFGHPKGSFRFDHPLITAAYSWTRKLLERAA